MENKIFNGDNGLANHFNGFHSEAAYNKFLGYIKFCTDTDVNLGKAELHTLMVFKTRTNRFRFISTITGTISRTENSVPSMLLPVWLKVPILVFLNTLVLNDWRIASAATEEEDYA